MPWDVWGWEKPLSDEVQLKTKSGFVGIVGPTNSGKSTLLNALMGKKLSIVSARSQTTYHGVRGILHEGDDEVVLTDTPGFQGYPETVARLLNNVAEKHAAECDALLWVFDVSNPNVLRHLENNKARIATKPKEKSVAILNKIDRIPKPKLLPFLTKFYETGLFCEIVPIAALKQDGVESIRKIIHRFTQASPHFYPQDQATDRPKEFLMAEFVREKIYRATREELPYTVWVEMEEGTAEERAQKVPVFRATIHVDGANRKKILIGKKGSLLKIVGTEARKEIEQLLGKKVCLKLHVDVDEKWRENSNQLNRYLEL